MICSDVVLALSNCKFLTSKHWGVGLGLNSRTGSKEPIVYLSNFAHSISYKQIEETEAAQVQLGLKLPRESSSLLLLPTDNNNKVWKKNCSYYKCIDVCLP